MLVYVYVIVLCWWMCAGICVCDCVVLVDVCWYMCM